MSAAAVLWRYNYKILMGAGYWILVMPIAASQIVTLWMMALAHDFNQNVGTSIAELMAPILGAFLAAHTLAPEYRSGIGSVLACKPVSLWRVVTIRAGLALAAALLLTFITLFACSIGLQPIDIGTPLLVSLPSLWFLSMLALTLATFFRSALAGFAGTAAIWALNVTLGYAAHPLLALQGYSASLDGQALARLWMPGKIALLVAGTLFLVWNARLVPRLGRAADRADLTRIAGSVAVLVLVYILTGAATTVGYAYVNRGRLNQRDVLWLRLQMRGYGPLPIAAVFGPAFTAYLAEPPPAREGGSEKEARMRLLQQALERWPRSMWADGIAIDLAFEQDGIDPRKAVPLYFAVADRYATSPFAPRALAAIFAREKGDIDDADRLSAARRLLADYPQSVEAERAGHVLEQQFPGAVKEPEMLAAALSLGKTGPRAARPYWLVAAARLQWQQGQADAAVASAREAKELGQKLLADDKADPSGYGNLGKFKTAVAHAIADADEVLGHAAK